ncbi:hypothetical protein Vadar_029146 [Vaccinium darrowii]|uniref:Uncharacterized protein n=1 Tax=Vaccinium darrowii TaxID=229202 RepID=A0ACB7Z7X4_9ERIC|nr:hypothetical protein Vadar_029146 [Vaccinium darrowii]
MKRITHLRRQEGGQAVTFDWLRMYFSELRSKVNVAPLVLLEDLDRVSHYGRGASALAVLYRQLGQASRRDTKQLSGFLTLLEAWIDEHFPVFNPAANPDYTEDLPRVLRWVLHRESGTSQSYYRKLLDNLGADQVIFNPYQKRRQVVPSNVFYTSSIRAMHIVEPHLPNKVLRQFCLVQQIPADPIAPTRVSRGVKNSNYLGWFMKVSHPRVGCGEGIVRESITERVDAVLEVVDKALGNDTLQPLDLWAALKEVRDILRLTRTLTTYVRRGGRRRG